MGEKRKIIAFKTKCFWQKKKNILKRIFQIFYTAVTEDYIFICMENIIISYKRDKILPQENLLIKNKQINIFSKN